MSSTSLKQLVISALEDNKAEAVIALDVHTLTSITDTMIICSARSSRHLKSLADKVIEAVKQHQFPVFGIDGKNSSEWTLVDLGDVVLHVMMPETRRFYELEKLWGTI